MLTVRLDSAIENHLNSLSQEQYAPKSKIVKEALAYYFEMLKNDSKHKTPYKLGNNLFGKYESGRDNLSTAYKQKLNDVVSIDSDFNLYRTLKKQNLNNLLR